MATVAVTGIMPEKKKGTERLEDDHRGTEVTRRRRVLIFVGSPNNIR